LFRSSMADEYSIAWTIRCCLFQGPVGFKGDLSAQGLSFSLLCRQLCLHAVVGSSRVSGLLLEVYAEGCMTVTTSDDPEEVLGLANEVGQRYREELGEMETQRLRSPRPIELNFGMTINLERFQNLIESGQGQTGLWMQRYEVEDGMHRYTGADLHTNELINLDVGPDYAYLVTQRKGCMNAAPRLMVVSAQRISGKTGLYYEGAPLFA